jgi:hypothetical protein
MKSWMFIIVVNISAILFATIFQLLRKDIQNEFTAIRSELRAARQQLGPPPLSDRQLASWKSSLDQIHHNRVAKVNKSIEKFNLIVPLLNAQMFLFNLEKEAQGVLESGYQPPAPDSNKSGGQCADVAEKNNTTTESTSSRSLTDFLAKLFG